jgi:hypothetical protein
MTIMIYVRNSGDGYKTQADAIMGCGSILNQGCSPVKLKLDYI